jgi:hypothetical protein
VGLDESLALRCYLGYNEDMDVYRYKVEIEVDVEAFSPDDAEDAIKDVFGPGRECGLDVRSLVVVDSRKL